MPILPMVLVNGAEGIGTGWSTKVPNYDIREIVNNLFLMLDGKPPLPMVRCWECPGDNLHKPAESPTFCSFQPQPFPSPTTRALPRSSPLQSVDGYLTIVICWFATNSCTNIGYYHHESTICVWHINPLNARSQYTDFAQTSLQCQKSVYRRHGISTPPPEAGIPAARYINAAGQKPVYRICFLMRTGTGMPES